MKKYIMTGKVFLVAFLYCISMTEAGKLPIRFKRMISTTSRSDPASPTTTPTPLTTWTDPPTTCCELYGHIYPPGSSFDEGYDPGSNWCYGAYCNEDSEIIRWDNFNCKSSTTTSTILTTTPMPTTEATKSGSFSSKKLSVYKVMLKFLWLVKFVSKAA